MNSSWPFSGQLATLNRRPSSNSGPIVFNNSGEPNGAVADQRELALGQFELVELFEDELAIRHRRGQQQQEIGLGRAHLVDERRRVRQGWREYLVDDRLQPRLV